MITPTLDHAREHLDAAIAQLMEAATAATQQDALVRRALAEGVEMERNRWRNILRAHVDGLPRYSTGRRELLEILQEEG
jgi:hypothetical protein